MVAIGFFGLDSVGVELEGPFGTDANDLPLLKMGAALCDDLDMMVRTVSSPRVAARYATYATKPPGTPKSPCTMRHATCTDTSSSSLHVKELDAVLRAASLHLGWGSSDTDDASPHPHGCGSRPALTASRVLHESIPSHGRRLSPVRSAKEEIMDKVPSASPERPSAKPGRAGVTDFNSAQTACI